MIGTVQAITIGSAPPERLSDQLRPQRAEAFLEIATQAREALHGRVIWNVSSTAGGGGVAEMLHGFLRYVRGAGVDVRWLVIDGSPPFFTITKRVHKQIHGEPGDGLGLAEPERAEYEQVLNAVAEDLLTKVTSGDVVILHDPQTAGLIPSLRPSNATLIWRCHIGTEMTNEWTDRAWAFLRPYVASADGTVFSRLAYVPPWLPQARTTIIAPSLDPLSVKNQPLHDGNVLAILAQAGIIRFADGPPEFVDSTDRTRLVTARANVLREGWSLSADVPVVVQVSRWDRLKDMPGVLEGFVRGGVAAATGAHLLLVGPDVFAVHDDPEGRGVLAECTEEWRDLSDKDRATVSLVTVPMSDLDENAAIINALQRHARVIVQKSLKEGFGLTVAEGMWKGAPLVASAVGGIQDQVRDGVEGLLLRDPSDLSSFAQALLQILGAPELAARMGASGHERVRDHFLADRDLSQWAALLAQNPR